MTLIGSYGYAKSVLFQRDHTGGGLRSPRPPRPLRHARQRNELSRLRRSLQNIQVKLQIIMFCGKTNHLFSIRLRKDIRDIFKTHSVSLKKIEHIYAGSDSSISHSSKNDDSKVKIGELSAGVNISQTDILYYYLVIYLSIYVPVLCFQISTFDASDNLL